MRIKEFENKIFSLGDEEFLKYIAKEFISNKIEDKTNVLNNINTLKYINKNAKIVLIGRLEKIENGFEFSSVLSILAGFALALLASYNTLLDKATTMLNIEPYHSAFWGFILLVFITTYFSFQIGKMKERKNTAIYFKRILNET